MGCEDIRCNWDKFIIFVLHLKDIIYMEIIDNQFLRQFEAKINGNLAIIEYSLQERKIFLTKIKFKDIDLSLIHI